MKSEEINIFARTIYGEARGEYASVNGGIASLIAVGNVIMNRLRSPSQFGKTIQEVCQRPWQFSCWNKCDPNYTVLMQADIPDPLFTKCLDVAGKLAQEEWPDLTKGCDHYHAQCMASLPSWARGHKPKLRLGHHIFYQLRKGV